jgi:NTP pyrophosphatase (non-canonical NTP hydrolase)
MNISAYQEQAKRTLATQDSNETIKLCLIGLIGELSEVVSIVKQYGYSDLAVPVPEIYHIQDEIGDTLWYLVNLCSALGTDLQEVMEDQNNNEIETHLQHLSTALFCKLGKISEPLKKFVYANHELSLLQLEDEIGDLFWYIVNLCSVLEIDIQQVMQSNLDKLARRYPDGYSSEASRNRTM